MNNTIDPLKVVATFESYVRICRSIGITGKKMVNAANNGTIKTWGVNLLDDMDVEHLFFEKELAHPALLVKLKFLNIDLE